MWPFDQNYMPVYQQYAQGYATGNYGGLDPNTAIGHLQQFFMGAPLDMQQQIYQQHFEQMPYEQRLFLAQQMPPQYYMDPNNPLSMAQSFLRLGREQPGLLQRILGHPFLLGGTLALAGLVAHHMLSRHQQMYGGAPYGYNAGYQPGYLQQEVNQERRREQELQRELRSEERQIEHMERREERLEEREWHHRHDRDYY